MLGIPKLVSELKSDLDSKSYDVVPMCIGFQGFFMTGSRAHDDDEIAWGLQRRQRRSQGVNAGVTVGQRSQRVDGADASSSRSCRAGAVPSRRDSRAGALLSRGNSGGRDGRTRLWPRPCPL